MEKNAAPPTSMPSSASGQPLSHRSAQSQQIYEQAGSNIPDDMPPPYSVVASSNPQSAAPIDDIRNHANASSSSVPYVDSPLDRSASSSSGERDAILRQALEFTHHAPPPYARETRLQRPVAIPQVASGIGMPFSRGYAEALHERGVSMEEFVEFIDNLNIVSASSPPIQVLDAAAGIVGLVPIATAQIVGGSIQAAAKIGNAVLSKTRGAMFVKKVNSDFFAPRGLKMELVTADALKMKLGMRPDMPLAHPLEQSMDMTLHERRMVALQDFVSPVTFNVPSPNEPTNVLDKLSAGAQKRNISKQEKKAFESREKYMEESAKSHGEVDKKSRKTDKELNKLNRKRQHELEKRDKEIAKVTSKAEKELNKKPKEASKIEREKDRDLRKAEREFERELRKLDKEEGKAREELEDEVTKGRKDAMKEDKEYKMAGKVQWILISDV